jgi:hypothetical protein
MKKTYGLPIYQNKTENFKSLQQESSRLTE